VIEPKGALCGLLGRFRGGFFHILIQNIPQSHLDDWTASNFSISGDQRKSAAK
jgi:hypothetical protein